MTKELQIRLSEDGKIIFALTEKVKRAERQRDRLAEALRMTLGPLQDHQNLNRSLGASVAYRAAVAALEYEPQKANAQAQGQEPDEWNDVGMRLEMLDRKARAVIAAGRPHDDFTGRATGNHMPCPCPQCAAWDDLAELLKEA